MVYKGWTCTVCQFDATSIISCSHRISSVQLLDHTTDGKRGANMNMVIVLYERYNVKKKKKQGNGGDQRWSKKNPRLDLD